MNRSIGTLHARRPSIPRTSRDGSSPRTSGRSSQSATERGQRVNAKVLRAPSNIPRSSVCRYSLGESRMNAYPFPPWSAARLIVFNPSDEQYPSHASAGSPPSVDWLTEELEQTEGVAAMIESRHCCSDVLFGTRAAPACRIRPLPSSKRSNDGMNRLSSVVGVHFSIAGIVVQSSVRVTRYGYSFDVNRSAAAVVVGAEGDPVDAAPFDDPPQAPIPMAVTMARIPVTRLGIAHESLARRR